MTMSGMSGIASLLLLGFFLSTQGFPSPKAPPQCLPGQYGDLPNPDDCSSYYTCDGGVLYPRQCPDGLHFDPVTDTCLYPNDANCEVIDTTTEPPTEQTTPEPDTSKPTEPDTTVSQTEPDTTVSQTEPDTTVSQTEPETTVTQTEPDTTMSQTQPDTTVSQTTSGPDTTSEFPQSCTGTPTIPIPNPKDCSSFLVCDNGHLVSRPCPPGLHFSPTHLVCEDPKDANCESESKVDEDQCSDVGELLPNPQNCSTFFLCTEAGPVAMVCPDDLYFNENMQYCDVPQNSACFTGTTGQTTVNTDSSTNTTPNITTPETTTDPTATTTTSFDLTITTPNFTSSTSDPTDSTVTTQSTRSTTEGYQPDCPASGTTILPNPYDCESFYVCINGNSALIDCPEGYEFNEKEEQCTVDDGVCHVTDPTDTTITATVSTTEWTDPSTESTTWTEPPTETTTEWTEQPTETTTESNPSTTDGYKPDCPASGTTILPNPYDCESFYVCIDGASALIECPEGYEFNEEKGGCTTDVGVCHVTDPTDTTITATESTTEWTDPSTETTTEWTDLTTETTTEWTDPSTESTTWTEPPTETTTEWTDPTTETTTEWTDPSTESTTWTEPPTETTTEWTDSSTETTTWTDPPTETTTESFPSTTDGYKPDCPASGTTILPNPYDCGSFYVCIDGDSALIDCPEGYEFNEKEGQCTVDEGVCQVTDPPTETTTEWSTDSTSSEPPTESTTEWTTESSTEPPTDTTTEWTTETSSEPPTDTTTEWTTESSSEPPTETTTEWTTESSSEPPTETTTEWTTESSSEPPTETTTETSTGTPTEPTTSGPLECPDNPSGEVLFPNPEDCGSYYVCDNGTPILRPCPPGLHFSPSLHVCVPPEQAHCEANDTK